MAEGLHSNKAQMQTMSVLRSSPGSSSRFLLQKSINPSKSQRYRLILVRASSNGFRSEFSFVGLSSSVGSPPPVQLSQWSLGRKHITALSVAACAVSLPPSILCNCFYGFRVLRWDYSESFQLFLGWSLEQDLWVCNSVEKLLTKFSAFSENWSETIG